MRSIGYIALVAASLLLVASCGEKSPFVKRSVLEQSQSENTELKNTLQNLQSNFAKQNEDLASILCDLSQISSKTSQFYLNVENKTVDQDTIDLIHNSIDALKSRIDKLEKEANRARKLDKSLAVATRTIKELRETVTVQELKIAELAEELKSKESTIKTQASTITSQSEKINAQTETIAAQAAEQIEMIYQAGRDLEDIADNGNFKVTGKKDKNAVKEYRGAIYEKAAAYYESAAAQGHQSAKAALDHLKSKISE